MMEEEWRWALLPACLEAVTRTVSTLSRYLSLDYSPVLRLFKCPFFFFHCGLQDFQAPVNTHTHKDTLLFRLSFPHSCALFFLLCPISLPMCLPLPLYPSIYPSHTGFTSLLSTMACFGFFYFLQKWSNGWIRNCEGIRGCRERKERRNKSKRTPVACYLITAVRACHARLTGPLRSALSPL